MVGKYFENNAHRLLLPVLILHYIKAIKHGGLFFYFSLTGE